MCPLQIVKAPAKQILLTAGKLLKLYEQNLLTSIHVPDPTTEGDRQLFRYRKRLQADQTRVKNRIKDKFLFTGIPIPEEFDNPNWSKRFLQWLRKVHMPDPSIA
jgi:transposase